VWTSVSVPGTVHHASTGVQVSDLAFIATAVAQDDANAATTSATDTAQPSDAASDGTDTTCHVCGSNYQYLKLPSAVAAGSGGGGGGGGAAAGGAAGSTGGGGAGSGGVGAGAPSAGPAGPADAAVVDLTGDPDFSPCPSVR
jgi:hypothetical protein